jgi:hypothetical protein
VHISWLKSERNVARTIPITETVIQDRFVRGADEEESVGESTGPLKDHKNNYVSKTL